MMVLLKAVGALDHQNSKNDLSVCTRYGLRPKAMIEIRKIRRQLIQIGKNSFSFSPKGKTRHYLWISDKRNMSDSVNMFFFSMTEKKGKVNSVKKIVFLLL